MADRSVEEVQAALNKEIAVLQADVRKLTEALSKRASAFGEDLGEQAEDARYRASRSVRHAARYVRDEAEEFGDVIRDNPGKTAGIVALAAIVGVAVWCAACSGGGRRW